MKVVYIRWIDSHGWWGWEDASTRIKQMLEHNLECRTVGVAVSENEDRIVLVESVSLTGTEEPFKVDTIGNGTVIPKSAIIEMEIIHEDDSVSFP